MAAAILSGISIGLALLDAAEKAAAAAKKIREDLGQGTEDTVEQLKAFDERLAAAEKSTAWRTDDQV